MTLCCLWLATTASVTLGLGRARDGNSEATCPRGCSCNDDRTHISCNNLRMKSIPKLPTTAEILNLTGSTLTIGNGTFAGCSGLSALDLTGNGVQRLPEGSLLGLSGLRLLRLSDNRLDGDSLSADSLRPVRQLLESLDLSANPKLFGSGVGRYATSNGGSVAVALRLLTELRVLNLSSTGLASISTSLAPALVSLERLETIVLSNNELRPAMLTRDAAQQLNVHGVLKVLELANCGLLRVDPDAMRILNTVVDLDLSGNKIGVADLKQALDSMPSDSALRRLALARLGIRSLEVDADGSLISGLQRAARLIALDLSSNNLITLGRRQLAVLRQLERLDLSDNKIESLDPLNFNELTSLKQLVLSRNRIASLGDFDFENLPQLQLLDLSGNRLSNLSGGFLTAVFNIRSLDLSDNAIASVGQVGALELVTDLDLSGNQLTSPGTLPSYPNLRQLDLSRNRIHSLTASSSWVASSSLAMLNLSANAIADIDPAVFARHSPLVLDLSSNRLERIHDFGWRLSTQRLLLRDNKARTVDAGAFRSLGDLGELDLGDNALSELDAGILAGLGRLHKLRLDGNRLGSFLRSRAGQTLFIVPLASSHSSAAAPSGGSSGESPLEELDLSRNGIEALHDGFFRNLTRLRRLGLAGNRLSFFGDGLVAGLDTSLESLDLSANEFARAPSSALRAMSGLVELDLSRNPLDCTGCSQPRWSSVDTDVAVAAASGPVLVGYFTEQAYVCAVPAEQSGAALRDLVPAPLLVDGCVASSSLGDTASVDNSEEKKIILIVIGCTAFVILIVAGIIFWHHRWRLKKKQQKQHYKAAYKQAVDRCSNSCQQQPLQQQLLQHQHQPPLPCDPFLPPVPSTLPPGLGSSRLHVHGNVECGSCSTYHRGGMPAYV